MEVVFPKNLDELNYNDLKECVQKLESYVLYMKERLEFMMNKVNPTGVMESIKYKGLDANYITTGSIKSANGEFALNMDTGVVNMSQANLNGGGINLGNGAFVVDNNGNMTASSANITNGGISGSSISGGSINIGNRFGVDSSGNCIANSFNSANANITGGTINITGTQKATEGIRLFNASNTKEYAAMTPEAVKVSTGTAESRLYSGNVAFLLGGKVRASLSFTGLTFYDDNGNETKRYSAT